MHRPTTLTPSKRPLDALPRVTPRLREALALLEGSDRPGLALRSLRGSFRAPYDGADQQDAAEFLHYVLDALEDEADLGGPALVGDAAKRAAATRELDAVFGGVLETSIECERCGAVSTTRHGVCGKLDVCVPDDGAPRKNEVGCAPREPAAKPASLQDLVRDQYLASEVLEGDAAYACDASGSDGAWSGITRLDVDAAAAFLETEQATYLDVRTEGEFQRSGVVPGSVRVPMHPDGGMQYSEDFVAKVEAVLPDKDARILVGCAAGVRSELAIALLARDGGYKHLANVEGGFNAWAGTGKPTA